MRVSEVSRSIYHYTTLQGLIGILQSQSLWCTQYRFMNDFSEVVFFKPKLIALLIPTVTQIYRKLCDDDVRAARYISSKGGVHEIAEHDTTVLVEAMYRITGPEIYIASFCREHADPYVNENGLLSQWRGYGPGGGFAVVFNTAQLEEMVGQEVQAFGYSVCHLSDVIYSDDDEKFQSELGELLSTTTEFVTEQFASIVDRKDAPDATKAFPAFVECISRYKHRGFKEEKEVRIVALRSVHDEEYLKHAKEIGYATKPEKQLQYRARNTDRVSYIELFSSLNILLPIERIIVGPHKEKSARASTVREMVKGSTIEVAVSDIPFVS